jgi:hypothetical protein
LSLHPSQSFYLLDQLLGFDLTGGLVESGFEELIVHFLDELHVLDHLALELTALLLALPDIFLELQHLLSLHALLAF